MQGGRDPFFNFGDPFASFGGLGGRRSLISGFFGGSDPFDDPFFTMPSLIGHQIQPPPFGSMFQSSFFGPTGSPFMDPLASGLLDYQCPSQPTRSRGPIIEELNSDDEKEEKEATQEKKENPRKHGRSSKEPYVVELDDEAEFYQKKKKDDEAEEKKNKQLQFRNDFNRANNSQPQARSFTFQSSTATYGGANGAYYTSSTTRRSGSDGLKFEESKEANSATGQATHRVSRGIHQKGHSVSRKLNSDGRVDTMQTLHNLNEGELAGFEENWKGNARKHLPGWNGRLNPLDANGFGSSAANVPSRGGWALPSLERSNNSGISRPKTDVGNMVGFSSHIKSRGPNLGAKNHGGRG